MTTNKMLMATLPRAASTFMFLSSRFVHDLGLTIAPGALTTPSG